MPVQFTYRLTSRHRTAASNRQLGALLAFVAGAVNAGGFLAVRRYTSHMTGLLSGVADDLALGQAALAGAGVLAVLAFVLGAAGTALLSHWGQRRGWDAAFALPLLLEAVLLLAFGLLGATMHLATDVIVPATVLLLCFIMGLQNAVITKISKAQIRTTHMTGILTDIGIELGRLLYWNRRPASAARPDVRADRERLAIHGLLVGSFFGGALAGAWAFKQVGYSATVPLALLLLALALPPLARDLLRAAPPA